LTLWASVQLASGITGIVESVIDVNTRMKPFKSFSEEMEATLVRTMNEEMHKLNIMSLRDPIANCSCGRWNYAATSTSHDTDEGLRKEMKHQHTLHLAGAKPKKSRHQIKRNV
jgi:hypothetical protein